MDMQRIINVMLVLVLSLVTFGFSAAIDGTWKSTINGPGGEREFVLKFKSDGNTLTGTMTGFRGQQNEITNGKINGNRITFETVANGETVTNEGVLDGPTLFVYVGPYQFEVICDKAVEESESGVTGVWTGSLVGPDGDEMKLVFDVKADASAGTLEGTVTSSMGEYPFSNTKLDGNNFSFDVDLGGMVISHHCTLRDDGTVLMKYTGMGGEEEMVLKRSDQ